FDSGHCLLHFSRLLRIRDGASIGFEERLGEGIKTGIKSCAAGIHEKMVARGLAFFAVALPEADSGLRFIGRLVLAETNVAVNPHNRARTVGRQIVAKVRGESFEPLP